MTKKKATTRQPEAKAPWVEITPQPLKMVKRYSTCFVCERWFPLSGKDRLEIVPVAYLVNPLSREEAQRQEIGRFCENCLQCVLQDAPDDYKKRLTGIIYFRQEHINQLCLLQNHPIAIPPEEVWIASTAEGIAGTGQELRDLAAATGLAREEIVRRLIRQAKPEDL